MIEALLTDFVAYLAFLKEEHGLSITVHDKHGFLQPYMSRLAPYNVHENAFCLYVKSEKAVWDACIRRQDKVLSQCTDAVCFGVCHLGVAEYVLPVFAQDTALGFLSVSGYRRASRVDACKLAHGIEKFGLPPGPTWRAYQEGLKEDMPDPAWVRGAVMPAVHMLVRLYEETVRLGGEAPLVAQTNADHVYSHICSYLHRNFARKVPLSELSERCHCSKSYVSHLFRTRSGLTLREYQNRLRIKEAQNLLAQTRISVSEVAYMVGFSDANYFSNVFHRLCGMSPRAFRMQGVK